jgi:aspartate/methionine/tyrosine aminotransferase
MNLRIAEDFFLNHPYKFAWIRPNAGSISFPEWLGKGTVEEMCVNLVNQYSVMIVPGSMFDFPGNYFRLGLGRKNFVKGIEIFEKFLQISE